MGAKEEAVSFKGEGNKAIANREWEEAVVLYSKAIDLDPTQHVFYSNRAQVGFTASFFASLPPPSRATRPPTIAHSPLLYGGLIRSDFGDGTIN